MVGRWHLIAYSSDGGTDVCGLSGELVVEGAPAAFTGSGTLRYRLPKLGESTGPGYLRGDLEWVEVVGHDMRVETARPDTFTGSWQCGKGSGRWTLIRR